MHTKGLDSLFDSLSGSWDLRYKKNANYKRRLEIIDLALDRIGAGPLKILDYGCATGFLSQFMSKKGHSVVGADISERMLNIAANNAKGISKNELRYINLNYGDIESSLGAFDLIVCMNTLEYLDNQEAFLKKFSRMLNTGRWLLVSVPNKESIFFPIQSFIYNINSKTIRSKAISNLLYYVPYQRNSFYADEFAKILERYNFRVIDRLYYALPLNSLSINKSVRNLRKIGMQTVFLAEKR